MLPSPVVLLRAHRRGRVERRMFRSASRGQVVDAGNVASERLVPMAVLKLPVVLLKSARPTNWPCSQPPVCQAEAGRFALQRC